MSKPNVFRRIYRQEHVFLAHLISHIRKILRKAEGKPVEDDVP